ncbi:MAG: protein-glutamate O-methyltransferase CheR [Deltaproteobacteria bacterium]|nr:protein-glutamate O-methyltransferase CheR [Deltaproteobacteria bacterium]
MSDASGLVQQVLAVLAEQRGVDLRDYRPEATERGVRTRLDATGVKDASSYLEQLRQRPDETELLLRALLVSVTTFFREPALFAALHDHILPPLIQRKGARALFRAWVAGCATGEEAWSLATVLAPLTSRFDVVASDLDDAALRVATAGRYPSGAANHIPAHWRADLVEADGSVCVPERLRSHVVFERHDMLGPTLAPVASVVAAFDLVLCRNVLIYFDRRLQVVALKRLASVLEPGGVLVLGVVESLPRALHGYFTPVELAAAPGTPSGLSRVFRREAGAP